MEIVDAINCGDWDWRTERGLTNATLRRNGFEVKGVRLVYIGNVALLALRSGLDMDWQYIPLGDFLSRKEAERAAAPFIIGWLAALQLAWKSIKGRKSIKELWPAIELLD